MRVRTVSDERVKALRERGADLDGVAWFYLPSVANDLIVMGTLIDGEPIGDGREVSHEELREGAVDEVIWTFCSTGGQRTDNAAIECLRSIGEGELADTIIRLFASYEPNEAERRAYEAAGSELWRPEDGLPASMIKPNKGIRRP